mgnify:CR=1 FL=1
MRLLARQYWLQRALETNKETNWYLHWCWASFSWCKGPCKYVLVENCGLLDEWLLEYVVPNISLQYPCAVALTLARPLLWASFESTLQEYLPPALTRRIQSAYGFVRRLPQGKNPVEKRLVVVTGSEAELYIDEIDAEFMHTVGGQEDGSGCVVAQVLGLSHRCKRDRNSPS